MWVVCERCVLTRLDSKPKERVVCYLRSGCVGCCVAAHPLCPCSGEDQIQGSIPCKEAEVKRTRIVGAVVAALGMLFFVLAPFGAAQAGRTLMFVGPATSSGSFSATQNSDKCGTGVNAVPTRSRQVNLVLDDSGSMFSDGNRPLDRWSNAKYSLEVFAAMLNKDDVLKVYLTSDFAGANKKSAAVTVKGTQPSSARIAAIRKVQLKGGGTPYDPVRAAAKDLKASGAQDRWLVIVSDGEFAKMPASDVQRDLEEFAQKNSNAGTVSRVAFLAIGDKAPAIKNNPAKGVHFVHAAKTDDLLGKMTGFSNRIFARSQLKASSAETKHIIDMDMNQLLVFTQGENVKIGTLSAGKKRISPTSQVEVSWTNNQDADYGDKSVPAVPNKKLKGKLATFEDVPAGPLVFDISGAKTIDVFYQPRISFGVELTDKNGKKVDSGKVVGGDYTVNFGFMDRDCNFIESDLLGEVNTTATVTQDGQVLANSVSSGDVISVSQGDVRFEVRAEYLQGNTSEATIDLKVLRPAKPAKIQVEKRTFYASKLANYRMPEDAIPLRYEVKENGVVTNISAEEWATFSTDSIKATSTEKNIEFEIAVGEKPGELFLLPRAPGNDPFKAATGEIPVHIAASHVYDEQLNEAELDTTVRIVDDFSFIERLKNWFLTAGWKWLLALLAIIWILGYFVRPSFARSIKESPTISFKPKPRGKRTEMRGKFEKDSLGALIPYKARTATLKYAAVGFPQMQLRARRKGRIEILNWKQIARGENVRINGEELTKETTKPPSLRPTSSISAVGKDGTYDMNSLKT